MQLETPSSEPFDSAQGPSRAYAFTELPDLAAARVGGKALAANDEFFAPKSNLLKPGRGVFIPEKFTSRGKWMDGWETRRKRVPGHDWCVIELGMPGVIAGFNVDTNHFIGNYPEACSVEAAYVPAKGKLKDAQWTEILPRSALKGGSENFFAVSSDKPWTHVRLNIYPDGGVARLRVHGTVKPDWTRLAKGSVDLMAIENGGRVLSTSNMFFGPKDNLIMPGRAKNMGDGWETKRRRGPGHDWALLELGHEGVLEKVEVDTNHFKGNYPDTCMLEGLRAPGAGPEGLNERADWLIVLPRTKLKAHFRHHFKKELAAHGPFTHLRLSIYPDGGVSRLRVHGRIVEP